MLCVPRRHRFWIIVTVVLISGVCASTSRAGIVLSGGSLVRNGDPIYEYVFNVSLTNGTTFQQGDSFTIESLVGVGESNNGFPPNHFEPSDHGTMPYYMFTYQQSAANQPLPPPFLQNKTYPTSDVTWTNLIGPTVSAGSSLGLFGVETIQLPELYPTISSITLDWTATVDGGKEHESGTLTFYLVTPEPTSLAVAAMSTLGLAGFFLVRKRRLG